MEDFDLKAGLGDLRRNIPLLISTGAALCLFLSPTLVSMALAACVFALIALLALLGLTDIRVTGRPAMLPAAAAALLGECCFVSTWQRSAKAAALAAHLRLPVSVFAGLVGLLGCAVGAFALYRLSGCGLAGARYLAREKLPVRSPAAMKANLKRGWWFPCSALAFFLLNSTGEASYLAGLPLALAGAALWASQTDFGRERASLPRLLCMLTAWGICLGVRQVQGAAWGLTAIPFVYGCLMTFWGKLKEIFSDTGLLEDAGPGELAVYGLLLAVLTGSMAVCFLGSQAFYGTEHSYDLIYTSDSPFLVKSQVYLHLTNSENDLRQPLFAVFASPFLGLPYLLGRPFNAAVQAILLNAPQILLLLAGNFLLSKLLGLRARNRLCFMVLTACTYTTLLFSLMMEQYILAYFWLMLCLYLLSENRASWRLALWGAGGTLLTSLVILPFSSKKNPFRQFKAWFLEMLVWGVEFFGVLLVFCRLDVLLGVVSKVDFLDQFTGKTLTLGDKISQYTAFAASCFAAPAAQPLANAEGHISWQLQEPSGLSAAGILILVLAAVSAILNRRKTSSRMAAGWVLFSMVLLLGLGWGTQENGLILYSLYFGWAFLTLLAQLVLWLEEKLKISWLFPGACIAAGAALLTVNIPGLLDMLRFAVTYYPI